ncbi:hypothetical protein SVIOM74S_01075 [Streptomyces violarus]
MDDVLRDWERIARQAWGHRPGRSGTGGGTEGDGWIRAELGGRGERWGLIVLCGYRGDTATGRLLADRAAEALVLHRMLGGGAACPWEEQSAQSLLTDLVSGVVPARQLLPRARAAGLPVNRRTFVPLVVRDGDTPRLDRLLRLLGLPGLVAELADGATAVLLSLPRTRTPPCRALRGPAAHRVRPGPHGRRRGRPPGRLGRRPRRSARGPARGGPSPTPPPPSTSRRSSACGTSTCAA